MKALVKGKGRRRAASYILHFGRRTIRLSLVFGLLFVFALSAGKLALGAESAVPPSGSLPPNHPPIGGMGLPSGSVPPAGTLPPAHPPIGGTGQQTGPVQGPTTTDLSSLSLSRHVMFVNLEKGYFQIRDVYMFQNSGKATIVSNNGAPTLRFSLPRSNHVRQPEAQLLSAPQGIAQGRYQMAGEQILATEPIPPGMKFVALFYRLADEYGGIFVQQPVVYGSTNFAILPEKDRVQVTADGMSKGQEVTFQNVTYSPVAGRTTRGGFLRFSLKAPDSMGGVVYFYIVGGAFVALGTVLAMAIRVRRKKGLSRQVEREELLRSIAALDDRLANQEISSEEHFRERAARYIRLREISQ